MSSGSAALVGRLKLRGTFQYVDAAGNVVGEARILDGALPAVQAEAAPAPTTPELPHGDPA